MIKKYRADLMAMNILRRIGVIVIDDMNTLNFWADCRHKEVESGS